MIAKIFVDVEFNRRNNEVITLGALGCNKKLKVKKEFFALVQPQHLKSVQPALLKLLHLEPEMLTSARSADQVATAFMNNFEDIKFVARPQIIVWNRSSYERLLEMLALAGYELPSHRVVVFQDFMRVLEGPSYQYSFEHFLQLLNFKYNKEELHNSAYDLDLLSDMYWLVRKCLGLLINQGYTELKNIVLGNPEGLEIAGTAPWREEFFQLLKVEVATLMASKQDVTTTEEFSDANISRLCENCGFNFKIASGVIYIETAKGAWMIRHNNKKVVTLFHKNYDFRCKNKEKTSHKGDYRADYHDQKKSFATLEDTVNYIYNHDTSPYTYKAKKTRLDLLFEQLKRSKKAQ